MKTTKNIKGIILIIILLVVYIYVVSIQAIPDNIVIFEGENIGLRTIFGLKADLVDNKEVIETLSNSQSKVINDTGKKNVKLSLFENIFVKDVTVDVLPKTTVIPVGSVAGIKLYTSGVLVVGM